MLFDMLKILLEKHDNFRLLLPGLEEKAQPFIDYAKSLGVFDKVDVMGYRRDKVNLSVSATFRFLQVSRRDCL